MADGIRTDGAASGGRVRANLWLVGLVFALLAAVTAGLSPGAYVATAAGNALGPGTDFHSFVYYAFITLATVGYGDIVPATEPARALAVLMAVTGPLYMALVIAFLVGKFASAPSLRS